MKNLKDMKKPIFILPLLGVFLTCAQYPILSDLYNNRITVILKGTYESNAPYGWNPNVYQDDALASYGAPIQANVAQADMSLYLDIADIRLGTGTGKPANVTPEKYWVYFTPDREVFCSDNYANGNTNYKLLSCYNDHGDQHYSDFFSLGYKFPAVDVPVDTYNHLAIFFRKLIAGPSVGYSDAAGNGAANQTTTFDNRYLNGINLMDSILQFSASDTSMSNPLLFPLERTNLSLKIPPGRDPYVMEIRIFLKNLLMKHVIRHKGGVSTGGPITFVGPSDWSENHNSDDLNAAYQMGGNVVFTARIYEPANVGSIAITDSWAATPGSYYAVVPSNSVYNSTKAQDGILPYAATSLTGTGGTVRNLPPGSYNIYRTCDAKRWDTTGLIASAGADGYPETVSPVCDTVTVKAGNITSSLNISGVGACTAACP